MGVWRLGLGCNNSAEEMVLSGDRGTFRKCLSLWSRVSQQAKAASVGHRASWKTDANYNPIAAECGGRDALISRESLEQRKFLTEGGPSGRVLLPRIVR